MELPGIGDELWSLRLEHFPDRLLGQLRMVMRLGVGDALVEQPGVQFVKVLEAQPRREEALANQSNLVLDLTLLPARCRRTDAATVGASSTHSSRWGRHPVAGTSGRSGRRPDSHSRAGTLRWDRVRLPSKPGR